LAIASHDLRQPLQVIRGAHDILAKTLDGVVEQVQSARVEGAASALSDKLDQLADALRLFTPSSAARQEIVQLGALFTLLNAEFAEAASRKGLTLRIMPTRIAVSSNTVLLSGILRNLIGNAIDYTPSGGHVLSRRVSAARRCTWKCATMASAFRTATSPRCSSRFIGWTPRGPAASGLVSLSLNRRRRFSVTASRSTRSPVAAHVLLLSQTTLRPAAS